MKRILIGLIIGLIISSSFFLIKDFFSVETRVPKNHVTVRLQIDSDKGIDRIILTSTHSSQTIELSGQSETILVFPNLGEGEFKVCCQFEDRQEICSQGHYVEAGYSATLKITDTEIKTIDFY